MDKVQWQYIILPVYDHIVLSVPGDIPELIKKSLIRHTKPRWNDLLYRLIES